LPRKSPTAKGRGKRYPLNMRTTREVRELLERVAAASGRSLVQQAEHMIQSSLRDELLFTALGGSVAGSVIRPILLFLSSLESSRIGDWRGNPAVADAMRQAIGLIGEAAFSEDRLSKERQQEFLKSFYEAKDGDLLPIDGAATDVAVSALMAVQASGLAEMMVPLPKGRKFKAETNL
jgi:hypothetical protein